jgi:photosynthetic reaction center cytochrome c subunit
MLKRDRSRTIGVVLLALGLSCSLAIAAAPDPQQAAPAPAPQSTVNPAAPRMTFKNVQVLKDLPPDDLFASMNFISASLGVDCMFCHVRPFDKDDKDEKKTARKMLSMTIAINRQNFEGHREVTCNTCHRGSAKPVRVPAVAETNLPPGPPPPPPLAPGETPTAKPAETFPAPDALVGKYTQAIGGAAANEKLHSRVDKGSVDAGRFRGDVEDFFEAPDKWVSIVHTPQGDHKVGDDGTTAWQADPRGMRELHGGEATAVKRSADFRRELDLSKGFAQMKVSGTEKIGDRNSYVIQAKPTDGAGFVKLFIDAESGLLLRTVELEDTPLGEIPTQTDFSDYRPVKGIQIPFAVRVARPGNVTTTHYTEVQFNVAIPADKFTKPAPPPPGPPPSHP